MNLGSMNIERGFLRTWVAANALGLGAGMALFAAIAEGFEQSGILESPEVDILVGHLIGLLLAGALFGLMQWLVLRRYIPQTGWSFLGASAGLWLGYVVGYEAIGFPFDYVLGPALAAGLAGLAQWFALRRYVAGAGWWVLAGALGFMLGSIPGLAIAFLGLGEAIGEGYFGWVALNGLMCSINGAIGGAITGGVLLWLLRRPAPAAASDLLTTSTRS
jgi:hypothetical protein